MKNLNVAVALAAGLLGGMLSHYVWAPSVHADSVAPKEMRAQSFVLVDAKGNVEGTFSAVRGPNGAPMIKLVDSNGRDIWDVGGGMHVYEVK